MLLRLQYSWLGSLTEEYRWLFATLEVLHFIGLCLLIGTVALLDLRLLGFSKQLSMASLHKLLPWAFLGFGINLLTGFLMFASDVGRYYPNPVFRIKMTLILLAGLNALLFRITVFSEDGRAASGAEASVLAKGIAAGSLSLWVAVIVTGRLLPYFGSGG